ncbi:hypothetical protein SBA4_3430012 [Candidatus Sulfopaludibacter sp. SbA4]|nr:hypothetical protein SBA4_3430012 [Candidatus Sulfopaludibacter sp. SbA4]
MEQMIVDDLIPAIVTWIEEQGSCATKTKLLKLLYLFDVEYYRQHRSTFTGFGWKFLHLGPWAAEYDPALSSLLARGVLFEQRSSSPEYDTAFLRPVEHSDAGCLFGNVKDECVLLGVLKRWGTRTTGEILNYVYFQTEPMEAGIRNEPLDFSLIAPARPVVYSRSSSGKSPAEIRKLRAKFERQQAEKKGNQPRPFKFTRPKYDEEYFEAMGKIETA